MLTTTLHTCVDFLVSLINSCCSHNSHFRVFLLLQELISGGSLIKEAVRRLQKPLGGVSALAGSPGSGPAGRMTPRKGVSGDSGRRTAYDSEDSDNEDCRTPPEDASVQQQQQQPPSVRNRSFPSFCEVGL